MARNRTSAEAPWSMETSTTTAITVRSGDTLSGLAKKHGVTLDSVMRANQNITDPNMIRVGQKLNMPTHRQAKGRVYKDWDRTNPKTGRTLGESVRGGMNPHTPPKKMGGGGSVRKKYASGGLVVKKGKNRIIRGPHN